MGTTLMRCISTNLTTILSELLDIHKLKTLEKDYLLDIQKLKLLEKGYLLDIHKIENWSKIPKT